MELTKTININQAKKYLTQIVVNGETYNVEVWFMNKTYFFKENNLNIVIDILQELNADFKKYPAKSKLISLKNKVLPGYKKVVIEFNSIAQNIKFIKLMREVKQTYSLWDHEDLSYKCLYWGVKNGIW